MERIVYRKTLDVHKNGIQFTLQGFETADNMARRIEISLMASGDTIDLPLEQLVAIMYVTTPNATEPSINECTIKDNTIIYDVLPIVEEGITEMQLKLIETRVDGAKSVLPSPRFAAEVTNGNANDESATQTTTFTALEDAIAKANGVYDARLTRIEVDSDCTFRAIYADGTIYETDVLKEALYKGEALLSQSYARGDSGIREGEETDNSLYYSNVSRGASIQAEQSRVHAEGLLMETRKYSVYTAFLVDFESGEVEYISPSYDFSIDKESGELEVQGEEFIPEAEVDKIVTEWLESESAILNTMVETEKTAREQEDNELNNKFYIQQQAIEELGAFKNATGKLLFDGELNDGDSNVTIEDISKYNVLSCVIHGEPSIYESVYGTMVLQKANLHFYGTGGALVVEGNDVTNECATFYCDLWCDDDTITSSKIKCKTENDTTILPAKIYTIYGIC